MVATPRRIERESTVVAFVVSRLEKTRAQKDYVTLKDAYEAYCMGREDGRAVRKGEFKEELLAMMGEFSLPSGAKKNYWRGWVLKDLAEEEETPG